MSSTARIQAFRHELDACWDLSQTGRSSEAVVRSRKLYDAATASGATEIMARAAHQLAWFCIQVGRAEDGLEPIRAAQRHWADLNNLRETASATAIHARVLFDLGLTDEAHSEASEALRVSQEIGDVSIRAFSLDVQAITMIASGEMESGGRLLDEALALQDQYNDPYTRSMILIHKALLHSKSGDAKRETGDMKAAWAHYALAIDLNEQAIAITEKLNDGYRLRLALTNAAEVYAIIGDSDAANDRLERWLDVSGEPGDSRMVNFLYTKADLFSHSGDFETALDYARQALELSEKTGITDHAAQVHRRLCDIYEALGDYRAALSHHRRFHVLERCISSERAQRQARVSEARLETDKIRALLDQATKRVNFLAQEALRDPLTGVANRRALDRELLRLSQKSGMSYAVAIVDLDHFKSINDTFTHMVGDDVLKQVARILSDSCRGDDIVARMGGEEFALLLPNTRRIAAGEVCERIRHAIFDADWSDLVPGLSVSASFGVADNTDGRTPLDVMAAADTRLYAAKAGGRNRVEFQANDAGGQAAMLH